MAAAEDAAVPTLMEMSELEYNNHMIKKTEAPIKREFLTHNPDTGASLRGDDAAAAEDSGAVKRPRDDDDAEAAGAQKKKMSHNEELKAARRNPLVQLEKEAKREGEECRSGRNDEVNYLDKEIMVGLRKKLYNFPKSKAAHEKFKIVIKAKPVSTKFKENEEGLRRRMQWAAAVGTAKSDDPEVTKILDELIGFDDIPKRHPKFINYMRTRVKVVDPEMVEKVWAILAPLRGQQGQKGQQGEAAVEGAAGEAPVKVEPAPIKVKVMIELPCKGREKKKTDFRGKLYLAPLTTTGNMPFRRVCKDLGVDITCGEMAMAQNLLTGAPSEWALLRRHKCEDIFGVQIAGGHSDIVAPTVELLESQCELDFVDMNCGCPIDLVCKKGAGSSLLLPSNKKHFERVVRTASTVLSCPLTVKLRTGYTESQNCAHQLIPQLAEWGASAITLHGRTRTQRYSKLADWKYIHKAAALSPVPIIGNGDIYTYMDYRAAMEGQQNSMDDDDGPGNQLASVMIGRGALIKPWLFTEIKELRHWDISAHERLGYFSSFVNYGLEHWGSDDKGVATTRRYLLEWMSFTHRYIPVGILGVQSARINWRPPRFEGRNDLETMLASSKIEDWLKISELAGLPQPKETSRFDFKPKHNSYSYDRNSTQKTAEIQG